MALHVISDSEVSGFKICSVRYHSYSNLFVYCNIHFCYQNLFIFPYLISICLSLLSIFKILEF